MDTEKQKIKLKLRLGLGQVKGMKFFPIFFPLILQLGNWLATFLNIEFL